MYLYSYAYRDHGRGQRGFGHDQREYSGYLFLELLFGFHLDHFVEPGRG